MVWTPSLFPAILDVFPTLIEGWNPDVSDDFDSIANAVWRIESVLGTTPKGSNADVAARINTFMRTDGWPINVQIATATVQIADLISPGTILFFNYSFPSTSYTAIISSVIQSQSSSGAWEKVGQNHAWISTKSLNSVQIRSGYTQTGGPVSTGDTREVRLGVLAIHDTFTEG